MTTITDHPTEARPGRPRRRARPFVVLMSLGLMSLGTLTLAAAGGAGTGVAAAATPTVLVGSNPTFGAILTTASGMALYTLNTDHNGQSTCHGSCAAVWPPLNVPAGTTATGGPGVTGVVGTSVQANGTFQVTYNGAPLYTFVSDSAPGQVTGNGVTGFFVVTVSPATTTTTTAAGSAPSGTAAPSGTPGTPAPATTSSGPTPPTAASGASSPAMTSTAPASLAFTGAGPQLLWFFGVGLFLLMLGTLLSFSSIARRPRRARSTAP